jgi:hypothetical protein
MSAKITKEYLNKRLLIKETVGSYWCKPIEAIVLESSPSGGHFKLEIKRSDNTSYVQWCHKDDYRVIEQLNDLVYPSKDYIKKYNEELKEIEEKVKKEFNKYSSPTSKPSYWDNVPTSICSSDYSDASNITAINYNSEVKKNKWVHGMCNPPSPDWKKKQENNCYHNE